MQAFLSLDGTCNSNGRIFLIQRAEILTRRSNLTPQGAQNTVNDLSGACGTEVAFHIKQFGFTVSSFFSRDKQAAVDNLLRMEVILANTSLLLNTLR